MLMVYILVGIVFIGFVASVPFFKKRAMNQWDVTSQEMSQYANENGFFLETLGNNIKFKFNNTNDDELQKIKMGITTVIVIPKGQTSIFVNKGVIRYQDWKYTLTDMTIDGIDVKPGYIYSIFLLPHKEAKGMYKNDSNGKIVYDHLFEGLNIDKISLYITEKHYQTK